MIASAKATSKTGRLRNKFRNRDEERCVSLVSVLLVTNITHLSSRGPINRNAP